MNRPIVVDLDGTLVHTDMLHESVLMSLRKNPFNVFRLVAWLFKGKAVFKKKLALSVDFAPESLPYNLELIAWLKEQRAIGRKVTLSTASDAIVANKIANHLDIFDEVIATDGQLNLAGANKVQVLVDRFGEKGFDYVGNSNVDLHVWKSAQSASIVSNNESLISKASTCCEVDRVFKSPVAFGVGVWRKVLRIHQWMKNLLLFVPAIAAHTLIETNSAMLLLMAFVSFSLCASSVYIANDLMDLESDRLHPHKRKRPFAQGLMPIWVGVVLAPILLLASLFLAWKVGYAFIAWVAFYFVLTCLYTWRLKKLVLIDSLTLAMLYTLRVIAGATILGNPVTFWLLAFSVFIFLSLAFVKRYAELEVQSRNGQNTAHGRGYHASDASIIQTLGIASGYVSVLILALYLNSESVLRLYKAPQAIWGAVLVVLFWISWMWMQAHRGKMHDDPLVFAVKDKASLLAGGVFALVMAFGTIGWPW